MNYGNRFRLSRSDRKSFAILLVIITIIVGGYWLYLEKRDARLPMNRPSEAASREDVQGDSTKEEEIQLFPFDPNTTDSATFVKLGLQSWQARNALQYRRKGGVWRSAKHFSQLYGLEKEEFERLKPYIRIQLPESSKPQPKTKAARPPHTEKLPEGATLSLNHCDTTQLKMIPGIGSYYAGKICRYRERLGGFTSLDQLAEVEGLPEDIERWFTLEARPEPRRIRLNHASFKELVRHPYLNYEQVKVIVQHIHDYGRIGSWQELQFYEEFSQKDFDRLAPYFVF